MEADKPVPKPRADILNELMLPTASEGAFVLIATQTPAKAVYQLLLASQKASRELGPESPEAASAANDLGVALYYKDDFKGAAEQFRKVLASVERGDGGDDGPGHVAPILNLSCALTELEDYRPALQLAWRALAAAEKGPGPESQDALGAMILIANAQQSIGQNEESKELSARIVEIGSRTLGPEHRYVLTAANMEAVAIKQMKRYEEALPKFRALLETSEKVLGAEHPFLTLVLTFLADAVSMVPSADRSPREIHEEVVALLKRAHEVAVKSYGRNSISAFSTEANLGMAIAERGDSVTGERMVRKAQSSLAALVNPSHSAARSVKVILGRVLGMRKGLKM
ncbi:MAG: tetratricopeptide repeat protein [Deltaproteobacteria bacterium]|jgi:tetratricopeptide (TPR) repeat protein|nr:tetratricopeptide repeat protein [Deltaproteobacteria bacterium]